ncbi:uncharacterized protein [Henckelia pumila]|uniref:uncharacterized protein n=1 Tax=Henckelia pumila TaxID=405737 RepID=UPI003C6DF4B6
MAPRRNPQETNPNNGDETNQNPPLLTPFEQASVNLWARITRLLENQAAQPRKSHEEDVAERFKKQEPKEFRGTTDPLVAEKWIRSLETIFAYMGVTDADRVRCAIYMLKEDAALWWEEAVIGVNLTTLTWANFRTMFFEKYYTAEERGRLIREFMSLLQGDKSVAEYLAKKQFTGPVKGPNPPRPQQRQQGPQRPQQRGAAAPNPGGIPLCKTCQKPHSGQCMAGSGVCYKCKLPGHVAMNCPNARNIPGRVYVMQAEEADPDMSLITGKILVRGIIPEDAVIGYDVTLPSGEILTTSSVLNGVELELQGNLIRANLVVLPMSGFDLILGMDWLSVNGASIDFWRRSVSVNPSGRDSFIFFAAQSSGASHVISYVRVKNLLRKGCQCFLASLVVAADEPSSKSIVDVEIVCEFPDVFLDDVVGIPPAREVEFSIELMSVPLTSLTKKNAKYVWSQKCQRSFDQLKEALTSTPVLAMPMDHEEFVVYTDASKMGLGAVLMKNGKFIAYASRQLKTHEKKYPTHDLELAAVVFALKIWRHYLYADALSRKNSVLSCVLVQQPLQDEIQRFDLEIYSSGHAPRLSTLVVQPTLQDRIREGQTTDEQLQRMRRKDELKGSLLYTVDDDIVRYIGRMWVLSTDQLREDIMSEAHASPYSIHPGGTKMYRDLRTLYWWPGMKGDIGQFVSECLTCQQVKAEHQRPAGLL